MSGTRHRCPRCHNEREKLWEEVEVMGWRGVDEYLQYDGTNGIEWVDWERAHYSGHMGCACGWEGSREQLERLGWDGEPLPFIHRGQTALEIEAA